MKSGYKNIEWLSQRLGMGLETPELPHTYHCLKAKLWQIRFLCTTHQAMRSLLSSPYYIQCHVTGVLFPAEILPANIIPQPEMLPPAKHNSITCYSWLVLTSFNFLTLFWNEVLVHFWSHQTKQAAIFPYQCWFGKPSLSCCTGNLPPHRD